MNARLPLVLSIMLSLISCAKKSQFDPNLPEGAENNQVGEQVIDPAIDPITGLPIVKEIGLDTYTQISTDEVELKFKGPIDPRKIQGSANFVFDQDVVIADVTLSELNTKAVIRTSKGLLPKPTLLKLIDVTFADGRKLDQYQLTFTPRSKVAFISEEAGTASFSTWTQSENTDGIAGASKVCQAEALKAGLVGKYEAWLSDAAFDTKTRFEISEGAWIGMGGNRAPIALSAAELLQGKVLSALRHTAKGVETNFINAHTGTLRSGLRNPNFENFEN